MKVKPLENRVLLAPATVEKKKGLIEIPDSFKEKTNEFVVLAVGHKLDKDGNPVPITEVSVGNLVLANRYSASEVVIDGKKAAIVTLGDIMAVLDSDPPPPQAA